MRLECPSCGSVDTRRAHRHPVERLLSIICYFPFLCDDCGARFLARMGWDEHRTRRLLRDLAAEAAAGTEDPWAPGPNVLITVQAVGQTGDLMRLREQLEACRTAPEWPSGARAAPPASRVRAWPDSSGWPDSTND